MPKNKLITNLPAQSHRAPKVDAPSIRQDDTRRQNEVPKTIDPPSGQKVRRVKQFQVQRRQDPALRQIQQSQTQQRKQGQIPRGQMETQVRTAGRQLQSNLVKPKQVKSFNKPTPSREPEAQQPYSAQQSEEMYGEYADYGGRGTSAKHEDYFPDMFGATTDEAIERKKEKLKKKRKGKGKSVKINKNLGRQIRIKRR